MSKNYSKITKEILSKELRLNISKIKPNISIYNNSQWDLLII